MTLLSRGNKTFEQMGKLIGRSGDTVARLLQQRKITLNQSRSICKSMFQDKKKLFLLIDDTLIRKIHSKFIEGAWWLFDSKIGRRVMAYRLMICAISDGKFVIPIDCAYLFVKEFTNIIDQKVPTKDNIAKAFIKTAFTLFPKDKLTIVVDGLYSTVKFLKWCSSQKIRVEARMHSNRVVLFKGKKVKIKELINRKGLRPKGRQMARTISIVWYNIDLELTIVRRIDKNGDESFVFQVATYKDLPRNHVKNYKKRWAIEKLIRTTKQKCGLQSCQSRSFETQHNHVASVFLAYALAQVVMKKHKLKTPEQAIRRLETKNVHKVIDSFASTLQEFQHVYA